MPIFVNGLDKNIFCWLFSENLLEWKLLHAEALNNFNNFNKKQQLKLQGLDYSTSRKKEIEKQDKQTQKLNQETNSLVDFFLVFWKLKIIFKTISEKLLLVYVVHPAFLKGGSDYYGSFSKNIQLWGKEKNRPTSCIKFCIPCKEVKELFKKTLLNKKLFKHCKIRCKQQRDSVTDEESCKHVTEN